MNQFNSIQYWNTVRNGDKRANKLIINNYTNTRSNWIVLNLRSSWWTWAHWQLNIAPWDRSQDTIAFHVSSVLFSVMYLTVYVLQAFCAVLPWCSYLLMLLLSHSFIFFSEGRVSVLSVHGSISLPLSFSFLSFFLSVISLSPFPDSKEAST